MTRIIISLIIILSIPDCHIAQAETKLIRQTLTDTTFYISLPPDFCIKRVEGSDFVVYYFNPADTTHRDTFSFGLYIGNFPSGFKQSDEHCNKEVLIGNLLAKPCKWGIYHCNDHYFIETIIENGDINTGEEWPILRSDEKIHAFGNSKKKEDLDTILEIFSTFGKENK